MPCTSTGSRLCEGISQAQRALDDHGREANAERVRAERDQKARGRDDQGAGDDALARGRSTSPGGCPRRPRDGC